MVGAGVVLGGLLAVGTAPSAAMAAPVGCGSSLFYTASGSTTVFERTPSGTITSIDTAPTILSTLAYNPVDGNLYGFSFATAAASHLFRIEAGIGATDLGVVSGLPSASVYAATFDDSGTLRVAQNGDQALYSIDVTSLTATRLPLASALAAGDLAFIDGTLYALRTTAIDRIDITTGARTSTPIAGLAFPSGQALWAIDGHLYTVVGTNLAEIVNYASPTPTLQAVAPAPPGGIVDGTACEAAPNPFLNAAADDFTATALYAGVGGSVGNVYSDDTLAGAAFAPAAVTATVVDGGGLAGVSIATDGTVTVPATATAGTYDVNYRICETATGRTNVCDTATAKVLVRALPVVDAVNNDFTATAITPGTAGAAGNVLTGDTIDGAPATPAAVTATITNDGGLTGAALTAAGDLTVPATATAGTYTVTYQVCATAPPTACDTATAAVRVAAVQPPPATGPGGPGAGTGAPAGGSPAAVVTNERDDTLASTGSDVATAAPWAVTAILLTLAGAVLLLLRRRKAA
jgi:hypothetical protein